MCFFFKQKTAYELRISDWSSDVCSSDLETDLFAAHAGAAVLVQRRQRRTVQPYAAVARQVQPRHPRQQRALARAGGADDGHGFTVRDIELGRASCTARVCQYVYILVVPLSLKKKNQQQLKTIYKK